MYDLLIKNGRVIDPAQHIDKKMDVAVNGDKIALVAEDIPRPEAKQVISAVGKIVTPGIIDVHCHVAGDLLNVSVDPDTAGVNQCVTTVVDGGSAGEAVFNGFPRYLIPSSRTRIYCFLNLSSTGLAITPELSDWDEVNVEGIAATVKANPKLIKGIKIRLLGGLFTREGIKLVEKAKQIAGQFGLPIMVHIGDFYNTVPKDLTRETLKLMERGDIVDHIYTPKYCGALDDSGKVIPELVAAGKRGVVLDAAMGRNNFSFRVARTMIQQGVLPMTISTDLGSGNIRRPVFGMPVTMTKFLALGLDLPKIIEAATINPARAIGEDSHLGSLKKGMDADISILDILPGKWRLEDTEQKTMDTDRLLSPFMTVKGGQAITPQPLFRPEPLRG